MDATDIGSLVDVSVLWVNMKIWVILSPRIFCCGDSKEKEYFVVGTTKKMELWNQQRREQQSITHNVNYGDEKEQSFIYTERLPIDKKHGQN